MQIQKFNLSEINPTDYNTTKKKYFITNENKLNFNGYERIPSIDAIPEDQIKNFHYFLFFHSDSEYLYHIDKIIRYSGTFSVHARTEKTNYVHSSRECRMALLDTLKNMEKISHYNEIIHGNICQALEQTRHLDGAYVEIGVYKGGSALTAFNYMRHANIKRPAYLLDTYDGFNYQEAQKSSDVFWNNTHKLWGENETMKYVSIILKENNPTQEFYMIKSNVCSENLPSNIEKIAVANIDVDMYDATRDAIFKVAEKMVVGGIMIAEDPASTPLLIGAFYAMSEFLKTPLGSKFMKIHVTGQYFLIRMKE